MFWNPRRRETVPAGTVVKRTAYADTLERLANSPGIVFWKSKQKQPLEDPIHEFYRAHDDPASIASRIAKEFAQNGANIEKTDLGSYNAEIKEERTYRIGDNMITCGMGLPSGTPLVLMLLRTMHG